jgi:tRNA pseudouridine38-40 synthase
MPLYKLIVAYDGTRFNGFQRQSTTTDMSKKIALKRPHWDSATGKRKGIALTVQECLEQALMDWTGNETNVEAFRFRFAGRTDKGVHARGQVVAVQLPIVMEPTELWRLHKALNSRLPVDVSVERVELCENQLDFDPRHDVQSKQYSYTIKFRRKAYNEEGQLLPICTSGPQSARSAMDSPCLWLCPWVLDDSKLYELCQRLQGQHSFRSFVHRADRNLRDHNLTLDRVWVEALSCTREDAPVVTVRLWFQAKGFRRSMVRNLVGFCVDVCRGMYQPDWDALWEGSDEIAQKVHSAPACGLCLESVAYS